MMADEHLLKKQSSVQNIEFFAKVLTQGVYPNPDRGDEPTVGSTSRCPLFIASDLSGIAQRSCKGLRLRCPSGG
jgi:hypothetical protein